MEGSQFGHCLTLSTKRVNQMKHLLLTLIAFTTICTAKAQAPNLKVNAGTKLFEDSIESVNFLSSLNQFLSVAETNASTNAWVYQPHFLQTAFLLDELLDLQKNAQENDDSFYTPTLLDIVPIEEEQFLIQVAYIGTKDNAPQLRATIELIAQKDQERYLFSSPLARNTADWKTLVLENYTFHYQDTLDVEKAKEFQELTAFYDERLKIEAKETVFYLCENGVVSQRYFGLPYKLDYNGEGDNMSWFVANEQQEAHILNAAQFFQFDPHDLFHNRLSLIKSRRAVNHAVDEGIATLYGGSWGYTWEELFAEFRNQIPMDKKTDWLELKKQKVAFETDGHSNPTDIMVIALFVQKIEREHGFAAVWELLNAKGEEAYFKTLKQWTGITKKNYNKEAWKLIEEEANALKNV